LWRKKKEIVTFWESSVVWVHPECIAEAASPLGMHTDRLLCRVTARHTCDKAQWRFVLYFQHPTSLWSRLYRDKIHAKPNYNYSV